MSTADDDVNVDEPQPSTSSADNIFLNKKENNSPNSLLVENISYHFLTLRKQRQLLPKGGKWQFLTSPYRKELETAQNTLAEIIRRQKKQK